MANTQTMPAPQHLPATALSLRTDRERIDELAAAAVQHSYDFSKDREAIEQLGQAASDLADALDAERAAHATTRDLRLAEQLEVLRLQNLLIKLAEENRQLRLGPAFDALSITITGVSAAELNVQLEAETSAEKARQRAASAAANAIEERLPFAERQRAPTIELVIQPRAAVRAYQGPRPVIFDVTDTDVVDAPAPGRDQTVRLAGGGR